MSEHVGRVAHMGVSENRGPQYSTLYRRILIISTPKLRHPNFGKVPYGVGDLMSRRRLSGGSARVP